MYGFDSFALLPHALGAGPILAGSLAIVAFVWVETRIKNPVLNITLFRGNKAFALSNVATLINYSATFATTFFLSLYLQYIKKLDPETAGEILVCQPVVMAIFSPFAGRLSDRIEPRIVASMGMALGAAGLFLLAFLDANTTWSFIVIDLVILGLGMALFSSPNTNAVMSSVEKRFYGVASGTLGTMRLTGQMFSMGIAIFVFAIHIGHTQITPQYYPVFLKSMRSAFIFFGLLCTGGVFASLARGKVH
jgi:MFS family permease